MMASTHARTWVVVGAVTLAAVLLPFAVFRETVEAWALERFRFESAPAATVAAVVFLLGSDVLLPIPSSAVATASGAFLGFSLGAFASTVGMTVSSQVGYLLGRLGQLGLGDRLVEERELTSLGTLWQRKGLWAIAAARPVPVLAEMSAFWAGLLRVNPWSYSAASFAGNVAASTAYAALGAGIMAVGLSQVVAACAVIAATFVLVRRAWR